MCEELIAHRISSFRWGVHVNCATLGAVVLVLLLNRYASKAVTMTARNISGHRNNQFIQRVFL